MIVALVAVEAHAQEGLGNVLGHLARITQGPQVVAGGILEGAAAGKNEIAHHLVVGPVGGELILDPAAEHPHALLAKVLRIALEQIGKLVGPESAKGLRADQDVDECIALGLGGPGIGQEGAHAFGRGRLPGEVEGNAADEFRVGAALGGIDPGPLKLAIDVTIDLTALGHGGELKAGAIAHHHHLAGGVQPLVANQHRHLTPSQRGERGVLHQGHLLIVAGENGLTGDVARGAVGIGGHDQELLLPPREIDLHFFRQDANLTRPGARGRLVAGAFGDPLPKQLVIGRTGTDRLASLMRHLGQGLEEHERFLDAHRVDAPAAEIIHQRLIIVLGVVAAEGQLEAILAFGRAMAGALIASRPRQNGLDVANKSNRTLLDAGYRHRQTRGGATGLDRDRGLAHLGRMKLVVVVQLHDISRKLERSLRREIDPGAIRPFSGHQDAAGIAQVLQHQ